MHTTRFRALILVGAVSSAPFLLGAQGKGCQPVPLADAGPDACVQNVLCVVGDHWDPAACRCVPDAVDAGPSTDATPDACVDTVLCVLGEHFDPTRCGCVPDDAGPVEDAATDAVAAPDACFDNSLCVAGDHWDPVACKCVPSRDAACVDNVLCVVGSHWDPVLCRCVAGCSTSADCHGVLPQVCVASCDGGTGACAHFVCRQGTCETVICE